MRYIVVAILFVSIVSCDCECEVGLELSCNSISTIEGNQELIDIIWMQTPNILVAEETTFYLVYISEDIDVQALEIESYTFELSMMDSFQYASSNSEFVALTDRLAIPRDSIFKQSDLPEGYAEYKIELHFADREGFVIVTGELLVTNCESISSGQINIEDCRYSWQGLPFHGDPAPLCI